MQLNPRMAQAQLTGPLTIDGSAFAQSGGGGILARLSRRKTSFLLGFGLTAIAVAAAFTALPRTYRASASLMVASDDALLRSGAQSAEAQRLGDPADIESQMLMLRSPRLGRMILAEPKVANALIADCEAAREGTWATRLMAQLQKPESCETLSTDHSAALQRMEGAFSIGPSGRSRVIEVSYVSAVPETAVIVSNALVDAYLRDDKERKVDSHDNAINWLNTEIDRSGEELRKAETDIETYRSQHGIVRGQMASISSERLSSLGQQLAEAQASYAHALSRSSQSARDTNSVQEVLKSQTVADLKRQAAELSARRADLQQHYGDRYPALLSVNDQLREVQRQLAQESQRVGVSLQGDLQASAGRVAELRGQFDKLMRDVGNTGGAEAGIAIMVRDVEARREIYVEQLKKVNILQTERRLLTGDARLVNHAEIPERPWFPKRLPFAAVGLVLSTAVGAGLGLLRDHGDGTLRSTNLRQLAGVSIAGSIPWVRARRGARWPLRDLYNPSPLQEAVRAIFSRCMLVPGNVPKTLMIGSSDVGEGKTFLTLALALFAVTTGRRVLVIEADLRRPTFRKALRLPEGPGLSEFLQAEKLNPDQPLSEMVVKYRGLHVITAGKPSVASTELLSKERFERLLQVAASTYDFVLIDSPPTLLLMDAQVLARRVDGIIYCASFGRSRLERVLRGINDLENAGGRMLGVVVGGVGSSGAGELTPYGIPGPQRSSYLPSPT
jgi:succinoglycan biosynthesis transport protein ExoP